MIRAMNTISLADRSRSRSPAKKSPSNELSEVLKERLEEVYDATSGLKKGDLGEAFYQQLAELDEKEGLYVLDKIKGTDFSRVRSAEGFSIGIIRRVKDFGTEENEPDFTILGADVKEKLERLIADGTFDKSDIDLRVVRTMQRLSEDDRKTALDRFEQSIDDTIRSKQGFFMGIVKRLLPQRPGGDHRSRFDHRRDDRHGRDRRDRRDSYGSRDRYRDASRYDRSHGRY